MKPDAEGEDLGSSRSFSVVEGMRVMVMVCVGGLSEALIVVSGCLALPKELTD